MSAHAPGARSPGTAGREELLLRDSVNDASRTPAQRIEALTAYVRVAAAAAVAPGPSVLPPLPVPGDEVNNHIHTIYSFSPYSPAMAALRAREAGLSVAGSVDHDSYAAAWEMREACRILGLGAVTGFELRVSFKDTPFATRKLNNPDSEGIAYMTIQGVPAQAAHQVESFLKPIRAARLERTRAMAEKANALLGGAGLPPIDFARDIAAQSQYANGGEATERHLLAAFARSVQSAGNPATVLKKSFGLELPAKTAEKLSDPHNPHIVYDLLGVLKAGFLDRVYIQPTAPEIVDVRAAVNFGLAIDAVPAYAYLGDVAESPTGDKKAEKFEDDFLNKLVPYLKKLGYRAITYMPPRNTVAQLARLQKLCRDNGFLEISGVDINSSRQGFNCPEVLQKEYRHLIDTTWALVAHEALAGGSGETVGPNAKLFDDGAKSGATILSLEDRVARLAAIGRALVKDYAHGGGL